MQWVAPLVLLSRQGATLRWTGDRSALTANEAEAQWRVREQSCRALALLLQGDPALAERAMKAGAMEAVGPCLRRAAEKAEGRDPQPTLAAAATKVLISLTKRAGGAVAAVVRDDLIQPLVTLLASSEDGPVRQNAGIALANLAKDPKVRCQQRSGALACPVPSSSFNPPPPSPPFPGSAPRPWPAFGSFAAWRCLCSWEASCFRGRTSRATRIEPAYKARALKSITSIIFSTSPGRPAPFILPLPYSRAVYFARSLSCPVRRATASSCAAWSR